MAEFMEVMESWNGYQLAGQRRFSEAAIQGAIDLLTNKRGVPRHRHEYEMKEAITTIDFPNLFGQVLDRQLMARYQTILPEWRQWCAVGRLPDFRVAQMHKVQGMDGRLALVPQKAEYPQEVPSEAFYTRQLFKYGRQFDISWEAIINDAMGAMDDIGTRFLDAALMTEAWEVTSSYSSAAGPNVLLFGAPIADVDGQNVTNQGVLALSIGNLQATLGLMVAQTDVNGRPLGIRGVHLVVPPRLEFTARQILTSAQVQQVDTVGGANANPPAYIPLPTSNILPQMGIKLHVDPLLPAVDTSGNLNTWYVFADPSQGKALQFDFLTGHETPEICMKASNKVNVTGGSGSPFDGDFDTDDIMWRVRHCLGVSQLDPRYCYANVVA